MYKDCFKEEKITKAIYFSFSYTIETSVIAYECACSTEHKFITILNISKREMQWSDVNAKGLFTVTGSA